MVPDIYSHKVQYQIYRLTQYDTKGKTGESENAIGEMAALRWEPTHVTKHVSSVIP